MKKIFKLLQPLKITVIILCIICAITYFDTFIESAFTNYWAFLIFLGIILAVIFTLIKLLIYHTLADFFRGTKNEFEKDLSKGFFVILIAGIIGIIQQTAYKIFYHHYFSSLIGETTSMKTSFYIDMFNGVNAVINIAIGGVGVYGVYLLFRSLRHYRRM